MEKIRKRVQKSKSKFIIRPTPLLLNASAIETQKLSETSNVFGEIFAFISAKEIYTHEFQRYKRRQEAKHINLIRNN